MNKIDLNLEKIKKYQYQCDDNFNFEEYYYKKIDEYLREETKKDYEDLWKININISKKINTLDD